MWAGFLAYLCVLAGAPRLGRNGRRATWAAIVVLLAAFAAVPPLLSHDVYSYVDYARLGALHGIDPYVRGPAAAPADPAFPHVTWQHTTSAYGPLFTLATYPLAHLPVDAAAYALKAAAALAVLATAALVARLAAARGLDPLRAAAFVALNPLVLVQVVGGGHNDALAVLLMTLGVAALLAAREVSSGAALLAAVLVKASTAFAIPFALASTPRSRVFPPYSEEKPGIGRLAGGMLVAALALGAAAYLAFGWHWLSAVDLVGHNMGRDSHLSIPSTLARLSGLRKAPVRAVVFALYAAGLIYLLVWTWRGGDWIRAAAWAGFGLLLATSWLLPWYLIWPLPLAALSRDRPLQLLLLALTAFQLGARIPL
jgi:Glycosyltransferase family 87